MRIETRPGKSGNGSDPIDGGYYPKLNSLQDLVVFITHIICSKLNNKIKTINTNQNNKCLNNKQKVK